jgi:hypothetical protein
MPRRTAIGALPGLGPRACAPHIACTGRRRTCFGHGINGGQLRSKKSDARLAVAVTQSLPSSRLSTRWLTAAGVEARYFELDSDLGHSSSGAEHAKWSPALREFLAPPVARLN